MAMRVVMIGWIPAFGRYRRVKVTRERPMSIAHLCVCVEGYGRAIEWPGPDVPLPLVPAGPFLHIFESVVKPGGRQFEAGAVVLDGHQQDMFREAEPDPGLGGFRMSGH